MFNIIAYTWKYNNTDMKVTKESERFYFIFRGNTIEEAFAHYRADAETRNMALYTPLTITDVYTGDPYPTEESKKKKNWTVVISNSADGSISITRVYGTEKQVKEHLLSLAERDRENGCDYGTDSIEEIDRLGDTLYAYSNFPNYHIDYVAKVEGSISYLPILEEE